MTGFLVVGDEGVEPPILQPFDPIHLDEAGNNSQLYGRNLLTCE